MPGKFSFDPRPTFVGVPYSTDVTLTVVPPNGVTLIPSAQGCLPPPPSPPKTWKYSHLIKLGVTFDPPQLQFSQNALVVKLTSTPWYVGNIPISWSVVGPDAWIYQIPQSVSLISQASMYRLK